MHYTKSKVCTLSCATVQLPGMTGIPHIQITWRSRLPSLALCLFFSSTSFPSTAPSRFALIRMLARTPLDTPRALLSVSILILSSATSALQVVPGSPCFSQCTIDGAPTTNASEIVCSDVEFNSTATGLKFKQCTECLQGSRQFAGVDTDVARYLCKSTFLHVVSVSQLVV